VNRCSIVRLAPRLHERYENASNNSLAVSFLLVRIGQQRLKACRRSSYRWFLSRSGTKPSWLERQRVMGSLGLDERPCKAYEACMEARVLELGRPSLRKQLQEQWKALRRGWYLGDKTL